MIHKTLLLCSLTGGLVTAQPLVKVVDLDAGETERVEFANGKTASLKLLSASETRDKIRNAVRSAAVDVEINGARATLTCGNYRLPVAIGGVQADCAVTRAYYGNSSADHWRLTKLARLRLWPEGPTFLAPQSMIYPVRQRWFATPTQMANEPTYVDGGEGFEQRRVYYHAGLDIGGAEGLTEVVSATDGVAVSVGRAILDEHKAGTFGAGYDAVYVLDSRGWYHCYLHLQSIHPALKLGGTVKMGQPLGVLGKEADSGGWAHLHYEIRGRQPSGDFGTVEGYAFLWEAYVREYSPEVIAVARSHHLAPTGEKVVLDGSRSWSSGGRIARYEWTFTDGGAASGERVERTYSKPGNYSEILKVTDSRGRVAWDFATVDIVDPAHPDQRPPAIHAAYWPTMHIQPAQAVTFSVRTFGTTDGEEVWDFGDGTIKVTTKSDGNVRALAKDGYAVTRHAFARPGDYLVSVERANARGEKAVGRLWIQVGR